MRKLIAAINMTLDGFCDHTAMGADEEIHQHYIDLLNNSDTVIYGRITYQLMESYWPNLVQHPSGKKDMDDFATAIDRVPKVVFSRTLQQVEWKTARIAKRGIKEEVLDLKQQPGKDIFVCSPSLIVATTNLGLVDEYQLSVHPAIVGKGLRLLKDIHERVDLTLLQTKTFDCGAVTLYYKTVTK